MCGSALARSALHLLSLVRTQHRFLHRWLWMSYSGSIGLDTYTRNSLTIAMMRKHTVKLHGHHCEISVHREAKHIWLAVGDYLGKEIRAQAESEGAAVKRWRETASTTGATARTSRE